MSIVGVKTIYVTCGCVVVASLSCDWLWVINLIEAIGLYEAGPFLIVGVGWCWYAIICSTFE